MSRSAGPVLLYVANRAPALGTLVAHSLRKAGFVVDRAERPEEVGYERLSGSDVILLDLDSMHLQRLAARIPHRSVIVSAEDCYEALLARQHGWAVIEKPFTIGELRRLCRTYASQESAAEWRPQNPDSETASQFMARLTVSLQHCRFCDEPCLGPRNCPVAVCLIESRERSRNLEETRNDGEWRWGQSALPVLIPVGSCSD